jgi:hypothetical protein
MSRESIQGGCSPAVVPVSRRLFGVLLMLARVPADAAVQPLLEIERSDQSSLLPLWLAQKVLEGSVR